MKAGDGALLLRCAAANLRHQPRRTAAAVAGIAGAVLLGFLQLGFLQGARRGITQMLDGFDFDLAIVSDRFQTLENRERFDAARLLQAAVVPGVGSASPLNVGNVALRDEAGRERAVLQLIGVPLRAGVIRSAEVRAQLPRLEGGHTVLLDTYSTPRPGPAVIGRDFLLNRTLLRVAGLYTQGAAFYAEGAALIDQGAWWRVAESEPGQIDFGLVGLQPRARAAQVAAALQAALPHDVLVLTRAEIIEGQQDYFVRVKPVGIAFQIGALVAALAAAAVLYQVLAVDLAARQRDFAALKAMGFSASFAWALAATQALLYGLLGFVPAALAAAGILEGTRRITHIPVALDPALCGTVLGLTLITCGLGALLALDRVRRADPADLFP